MAAKQSLKKTVEEEKVKGFVDILVARNVIDGLSHLYVISFCLLFIRYLQHLFQNSNNRAWWYETEHGYFGMAVRLEAIGR